MKTIITVAVMLLIGLGSFAAEEPLVPDGVNQILGRIRPDMSETQVEKIVQTYFPKAKAELELWSGQTGYVEFKLTSRYSISVAEYNDPKDFNLRFVHADMMLSVYDQESKRRIDISFYNWDEKKQVGGKTSEPKPNGKGENHAIGSSLGK